MPKGRKTIVKKQIPLKVEPILPAEEEHHKGKGARSSLENIAEKSFFDSKFSK